MQPAKPSVKSFNSSRIPETSRVTVIGHTHLSGNAFKLFRLGPPFSPAQNINALSSHIFVGGSYRLRSMLRKTWECSANVSARKYKTFHWYFFQDRSTDSPNLLEMLLFSFTRSLLVFCKFLVNSNEVIRQIWHWHSDGALESYVSSLQVQFACWWVIRV